MQINGKELNRDNIESFSTEELIQNKEYLQSDFNVDINEANILIKLINVELTKRKVEKEVEDLAKIARMHILEEINE